MSCSRVAQDGRWRPMGPYSGDRIYRDENPHSRGLCTLRVSAVNAAEYLRHLALGELRTAIPLLPTP